MEQQDKEKANFKTFVQPKLMKLVRIEQRFQEATNAENVDIERTTDLLLRIEQAEYDVWKAWAQATKDYNITLYEDVVIRKSLKRLFPAARKLAFKLCDMN